MGTLLTVSKLSKNFGGVKALREVSFSVRSGIIKALIGPNGAGKTTLFNIIAGELRPSHGEVFFKGQKITGKKSYQIAELGIARTFQTTRLFENMSVLENIMVGRHLASHAGFAASILKLPWTWQEEKAIRRAAEEILDFFGLSSLCQEKAQGLPFGIKRLVELARAFASKPSLLLLDEPAAGLNIQETNRLASFILAMKEKGITILLVEHDMSLVMEISDEVVVLNEGHYLTEGLPRQVQKDPEVIKVYLGAE